MQVGCNHKRREVPKHMVKGDQYSKEREEASDAQPTAGNETFGAEGKRPEDQSKVLQEDKVRDLVLQLVAEPQLRHQARQPES